MKFSDDQLDIIKRYTDDLNKVQTMSHYDYVNASGEKISKLLDNFHVIWFYKYPLFL